LLEQPRDFFRAGALQLAPPCACRSLQRDLIITTAVVVGAIARTGDDEVAVTTLFVLVPDDLQDLVFQPGFDDGLEPGPWLLVHVTLDRSQDSAPRRKMRRALRHFDPL
jgi:hypothetical protein